MGEGLRGIIQLRWAGYTCGRDIWLDVFWSSCNGSVMGKGIALAKYWAGLALCVVLLLVQGTKAGELKPLYFTCVIDSEAPYFDYIEYTYAKILEPLGYRFSLISGRPEEVRGWLSEGQADGDCGHIPGYTEHHGIEGYRELDISMTALSFAAWSNQPIPEGLKTGGAIDNSVRVGYLNGLTGSEILLRRSGITNTVVYDSVNDGKLALHKGEIDIWLGRVLGVSQFTFRDKPKHVAVLKTYPVIPLLHHSLKEHADSLAKQLGKEFTTFTFPEYIKLQDRHAASVPLGKSIHFNCPLNYQSPLFHKLVSVYRHAFKELGKEFYMTTTLPGREMANLTSGLIDGSCGRSEKIFENFERDSIVLVNVPVMNVEFQVWTHLKDLDVSHLADLNDGKLRVGYRYGLVVVEREFQSFPEEQISKVIHSEQGVKMLAAKRIDIYVDASERLHQAFKRVQFDTDLKLLEVKLDTTIYPVLNAKHRAIADAFEAVLKKQKPEDKEYLIY